MRSTKVWIRAGGMWTPTGIGRGGCLWRFVLRWREGGRVVLMGDAGRGFFSVSGLGMRLYIVVRGVMVWRSIGDRWSEWWRPGVKKLEARRSGEVVVGFGGEGF